MNLSEAQAIASVCVQKLSPYCDRIDVAGSVRRCKAEVKDIEVVCEPKLIVKPHEDMFSSFVSYEIHPDFIKTIDAWKKVRGEATGRYTQRMLSEGIALDIFIPQPHDYFRQLAIRTGSRDFTFRYIASRWVEKGWCGTSDGLRMQIDCVEKKEKKWECVVESPALPPKWESEEAFFEWLGLECIDPKLRELPLSDTIKKTFFK